MNFIIPIIAISASLITVISKFVFRSKLSGHFPPCPLLSRLYLRYTLISEAIKMRKRIHALLKVLESNQLDSTLITSKENVYYLSHYYTDPHERVIGVYISQ